MKAPATILAPLVDELPEDWALLAVNGEKVPINASDGKFQNEWTLKSESRELLKVSRHVKAVGVVCGPLSGGLIAIDFDGKEAESSLAKLTHGFGEADLPPTVGCSSGKPHRKKLFFTVSDRDLHGMIQGIGSGTKEFPELEILWEGRQAVVIGEHPETGSYFWLDGGSPNDRQVAEAPNWLIDPLISCIDEPSNEKGSSISWPIRSIQKILNFLNPDDFGGYGEWSSLGMAIKLANDSEESKQLFERFSKQAPKFDQKVFNKQWKAWASMDQFKTKKPNASPKTIASFVPQAKANGMDAQKPNNVVVSRADEAIDADQLEKVVRAQTNEKVLEDVQKCPNVVNLLAFLRHQTDVRIRWNELKRCIVIGKNKTLEPTLANVFLADQWKINAGKNNAKDCVVTVALENSFNPVREYFEELRGKQFPEVSDEQLADCFGFARNDSLSIQLLRIHLRACVSRGMEPGEKMDTLLVIKGEQGNGKSTALETLSPFASWYDETTRVNFDSRDSLSSLNSAFIYEFSEIEKILTTADVAQFKSWITRKVDKYCEKYETISTDHPRRCCLFGTTNASSFLMDPTGARRFLICENTRPANIKLLKELKEAIWHQSMIELENGLPSFLNNNDELFKKGQERAKNATISDPWEAELSSYLKNCAADEFVSSHQLLKQLNKPVEKLSQHDFKRLANVMKGLNWEKARRRLPSYSNPVDGYFKKAELPMTQEEIDEIF